MPKYLDMLFDDGEGQNIFGTGGSPSGFNPNRRAQAPSVLDTQRRSSFDFFEEPRASTSAMDMYNEHLNAIPERTRPGIGSRILSALAGGMEGYRGGPNRGIAAAQNVYEEPYQRKLDDYKTKGSILGQRANLEQNDNEMKYRNYISALKAREDADSKLRDDERADKQLGALQEWREFQKKNAGDKNWVLNTNELTGELVRVNTATGDIIPLAKTRQTPDEKIQSEAKKTNVIETAREPFVQRRMSRQGEINKDVNKVASERRFAQEILGDKIGLGKQNREPTITAAERMASDSTNAWSSFKKSGNPKEVQLVESFMDIDPRTRAPQFIELNANNAKVIAKQYGYNLDDDEDSNAFFEAYNRAKRIYNSSMMRR